MSFGEANSSNYDGSGSGLKQPLNFCQNLYRIKL